MIAFMSSHHDLHFPNESKEYREKRNTLLDAEIALRRQTEEVAQLRRQLPRGGKLKEDYVFTKSTGEKITFSELFIDANKPLIIYNMMFAADWEQPCPMCNSIVDGLNGNARQLEQRVNLVIIGKAPIEKLMAFAKKSNWNYLTIISSFENSYNKDYFGERDGEQVPMLNVFVKEDKEIYHTWGSELTLTLPDKGQDPRAIDPIWPLWNVLDLTPEGRGEDWYPEVKI